MRIGFLKHRLDLSRGGANASLHLVATELVRRGYDVSVITLFPKDNDVPEDPAYDLVEVSRDVPALNERLDFHVEAILAEHESVMDVYHVFGPRYTPGGGRYRRSGTTPVVARLNSYGVFCFNMSEMDGQCHRTCGVRKRFRHYDGSLAKSAVLLPLMAYADRRLAQFEHVDHMCAQSPAVERIYREAGVTAPSSTLLPNMYNPEFLIQDVDPVEFDTNGVDVVFAGRIVRSKGLDILLDAATATDADVHFHILGDGPQFDHVSSRAASLDNVTCHGYVDHDLLHRYYAGADVFLLPSEMPDPCPRSVLEALSAGLPCIVSDIGGPPWMVGDAGLTFPVGSSDDLRETVERLVADPDLRARLAVATESELARFEPERILDTYEEVYERFTD